MGYPPILVYHRVHPDLSQDTPTVSPEVFDCQMEILSRRWNPIPLRELVHCLGQGTPLHRRAVVVTFDDGTEDTFTYAFPILKRHRIPATVFLIANHIDYPADLKLAQIRQMADIPYIALSSI